MLSRRGVARRRSASRSHSSAAADDVGVSRRRSASSLATPARAHVLVLDALLEQDDALEQRLGAGRAARHVDVDGDDLVDALGDRVGVPVRAAAVGARPHGDHVLRVGHLLVEALDRRRHLVGDGAGDDDEVGLAGAGRERDDAEAHHVVAGRGERRTHLDGAAGEAPLVHPQRVLAAHVEQPGERLGQTPALDDSHRGVLTPSAAPPCARRTRGPGAGRRRRRPSRPGRTRRSASSWVAHGKMNTASTSNITKSSAKT